MLLSQGIAATYWSCDEHCYTRSPRNFTLL